MSLKTSILFLILLLFYVPLASAGDAIIWDSMVKEIRYQDLIFFQNSQAWANRANWVQVPYGIVGNHTFTGNPILDNGNFWVFMQDSYMEAPIIYGNLLGKPASQYTNTETPGENGLMYGNVRYSDGHVATNSYPDPNKFQIIKNQANEVILQGEFEGTWNRPNYLNIIQYRVKANSGWVEQKPMTSGKYEFAIHSGSRGFSVSPPSNETNSDYVIGASPINGWYPTPVDAKYTIYGQDIDRYPWIIIPYNLADSELFTVVNQGFIWGVFSEKTCVGCSNNVSYVGTVSKANSFMYIRPNVTISSGGSYTAGAASVAGRWRLTGRVSGTYYTQTKDVQSGNNLVFISPASGVLEAVVMYLYDRNSNTPTNVSTPHDIYQSIFGASSSSNITVEPNSSDNYIKKYNPTTVYSNTNYLGVGCDQIDCANNTHRFLVRFDISNYTNPANITNAILKPYWYYEEVGRVNSSTLQVYKVTKGYQTNRTSWNNLSNTTLWSNSGGDWVDSVGTQNGDVPYASAILSGSPTYSYVSLNVTQLVKEVVGNSTNISMELKLNATNEVQPDNYVAFRSTGYSDLNQRMVLIISTDIPSLPIPNITSWNNNITNNESFNITTSLSTNVHFNVSSNQSVNWTWLVDYINKNNNFDNISVNWSSGGSKTVQVYGTNANGSTQTITWNVFVTPVYVPPDITDLIMTNGSYWVNISWQAGTGGNITNSYLFNYLFLDLYGNISGSGSYYVDNTSINFTNLKNFQSNDLSVLITSYNNTRAFGNSVQNSSRVPAYVHVASQTNPYYNLTGSPGKSYTIMVRAYNSTYGLYSDWAESTVTLSDESIIAQFTHTIFGAWD